MNISIDIEAPLLVIIRSSALIHIAFPRSLGSPLFSIIFEESFLGPWKCEFGADNL